MKKLVVKVLVCGECVRTGVEVDRIYRTSDSKFGEDMMITHLLAAHGIEVGRAR